MKMRYLTLAILGSLVSVVHSQGLTVTITPTFGIATIASTSGIAITITAYTPTSAATTPTISSTSAQSSSTSSPSSPTPTITEAASNGGLSSGAKAGIGIGVALTVIIALSLVLFYFWRRKKQSKQGGKHDLEIADDLAAEPGNEMITSANTHEMDAKRPANFKVEDVKPEIPVEMDVPYNTQSTNVGSDWEHLEPSELDGTVSAEQRAELHSSPLDLGSTSIHPSIAPLPTLDTAQTEVPKSFDQEISSVPAVSPPSSPSKSEDKLEVLRKRMERVREDKERLEKIQALKDLEAELQAEILAEQKKATGS